MRIFVIGFTIAFLLGCYNGGNKKYDIYVGAKTLNKIESDSLINKLKNIAEPILVDNGYDIQDYECQYYAEDNVYVVHYVHSNEEKLGGDVFFVFDKVTMKLVYKKLGE